MLKRRGYVLETYNQKLKASASRLSYGELLQTEEWYRKRIEIIHREKERCQVCRLWCPDFAFPIEDNPFRMIMVLAWTGHDPSDFTVNDPKTSKSRSLTEDEKAMFRPQPVNLVPNVHHTFYVLNRLPWNYPNESLMLICHLCHAEIHNTKQIPVYRDELMTDKLNATPCRRCDSSGFLPQFEYYRGGVCFTCGGTGFQELSAI
jgi:Pyruvate/2-oxoacid:ferredoxin oxidoreductase delta subunit